MNNLSPLTTPAKRAEPLVYLYNMSLYPDLRTAKLAGGAVQIHEQFDSFDTNSGRIADVADIVQQVCDVLKVENTIVVGVEPSA